MPVRVYDIAKKLGVESKDVIAKAKELGISAARAPSSMLDKITAEFLESHLIVAGSSASQATDGANESQLQPPLLADNTSPPKSEVLSLQLSTTDNEVLRVFKRIQEGVLSLQVRVFLASHDAAAEAQSEEFTFRLTSSETTSDPGSAPIASHGTDSSRRDLDPRPKKLLLAAYRAASVATDSEWITLAEYGNTLKKLDHSFSARLLSGRTLLSFANSYPEFFEIAHDEMHIPPVPYVRVRKEAVEELSSESKVETQASPVSKALPTPRREARPTGRIHNIKEGLGFGFITPDNGGENVYFHASDLIGTPVADLRAGDSVSYIPSMNERGPCAREIKKLIQSDRGTE